MPASLSVRLLGGVAFSWREAEGGAEVVVAPSSRKGAAMLVFLAMRPEGARRETLAELLWGVGKLASVRQALYELRRLPGADAWLVDDGDVVRVSAATDVDRFERTLAAGDTAAAVDEYGGPLLGASPDLVTPAYHDWWNDERVRLEAGYLQALRAETDRRLRAERWNDARGLVTRWLELDPFDEAAHRAAIRIAHATGDLEGAREAYRRCDETLRREFGTGASDATRALMDAIERSAPTELPAALRVLTPSQLRLVQALVVAQGALGIEQVSAVLERPSFDVASDLEHMERAGLVDAHLTVATAHALAVRASTTEAARRLLHERTAAQLLDLEASAGVDGGSESGFDDGVVALHLLAAGKPADAAPRFVAAARKQVERGDLDAATGWAFRALWATSEAEPTRLDACLLLEGLASQRGEGPLQDDALGEAERLAWEMQADRSLAEVRMRRSRQRLRQGKVGDGLELALEALEIALRLEDGALASRARNAVGAAHYFAGDLDGAAAAFGQNVDADDVVERYRARNNLGSLAAMRGEVVEAYRHFEAALTLARASGQQVDIAATLNNLAATADRLGDYARAVKHFREGIALARRHDAPEREGQLLANLAAVYARQGQLGPAWNTAVEVEELGAERDDRRLVMHALEQRAEVTRVCGDVASAVELLRDAVEIATALDDDRKRLALTAQWTTVRALGADAGAGDVDDAIAALERARLTDVAPWLRLEQVLAVTDVAEAERLLAGVAASQLGPHQRFVLDVATLRAGLLHGASGASAERTASAATKVRAMIASTADGRAGTAAFYAEVPLARTLLGAFDAGPGAWHEAAREAVMADLAVQAEGLPKSLAVLLRARPSAWLRSLGGAWATIS